MKYWMIIGQFLLALAVQADSLSLLSAEGFGFADAKRFPESQARLMAVRAAKIDAQRNLLETINGVRVTAGTTVKDMALESDIIGTRTSVAFALKRHPVILRSTMQWLRCISTTETSQKLEKC